MAARGARRTPSSAENLTQEVGAGAARVLSWFGYVHRENAVRTPDAGWEWRVMKGTCGRAHILPPQEKYVHEAGITFGEMHSPTEERRQHGGRVLEPALRRGEGARCAGWSVGASAGVGCGRRIWAPAPVNPAALVGSIAQREASATRHASRAYHVHLTGAPTGPGPMWTVIPLDYSICACSLNCAARAFTHHPRR